MTDPRDDQAAIEVHDGDEYDAETVPVDVEQLGAPVDPPDQPATLYGTIVGTREHEREPLVPAWLRNQQQRVQVTKWAADYAAYAVALHAKKSPKYLVKVAVFAPWGVLRTIGKVLRWAWAEEGNWHLRQHAANRGDADAWLKLDNARRRSSVWRWWVVFGGALAAGVAIALLAVLSPAWVWWLVVVVAVPVFARLGRPVDKPITDRVSTGPKFVKLTGEMVRRAVVDLGIGIKEPGQITFPPPGVHRDGPGWLARFNLSGAIVATKVLEKRDGLAASLRLPVDQVWPEVGPDHPGQVDLWVGYQPSSKMGQPRWALASETARTSVFEAQPFATDARQRPISTVLFERNFLIGGQPGSGKSFAARTLATIAMLDPTAELKVAEFKGVGDFLDVAPLCSTYVVGVDDEAFETGRSIIAWALAECERRGKRILAAKKRGEAPLGKVTPELAAKYGSGLHPVVIVLDEVHELFAACPEAADMAERAIKRGRALNVIFILATQIPDKDSLPPNITRCVTVRWCLSVGGQVENDMILGTGAYKKGLTGTVYRPGVDAGWGVMTGLEKPGSVRSFFPPPEVTAAIVARATALRGGAVVGTGDQLPAQRDVLQDVIRVFAVFGRPRIHWKTLAELMAEHMPEAYSGVTAESISALVRDHGVPSEQVKVDGVNLQGCKRMEIEAAVERKALEA